MKTGCHIPRQAQCLAAALVLCGCVPSSDMYHGRRSPTPTRPSLARRATPTRPASAYPTPSPRDTGPVTVSSARLASAVFAPKPPPPRRAETAPPRPSPGHVWLSGNWTWDARRGYQWVKGQWVERPPGSTEYVRPRWRRVRGGWTLVPGHWRTRSIMPELPEFPPLDQPKEPVIHKTPPPRRVEEVPPRPSAKHHWLPGHWRYTPMGEYVWSPGCWALAPRDGATWLPARWRKVRTGWVYEPGRWR